MKPIQFLDSTLRDGAQSEGISFSVQDKLHLLQALDQFGISYIEGGNPASNPKDMEFFERAKHISLKHAKLCAFGSTVHQGVLPGEDEGLQKLLDAQAPVAVIFGKTSIRQVTCVLQIKPEENIKIVNDTVRFLKSKGKEVIFDAEHFFDGFQEQQEYALSVLQAAIHAGADSICLCDTAGGTMPHQIYEITKKVCEIFPHYPIGIHTHNDAGCGVANSLEAVRAGVVMVQGTFLGYGERCGNADLSVIIPDLQLKYGIDCGFDLKSLTKTAALAAELSNIPLPHNAPYTGRSAFSHKAGMHVDGVQKLPSSFEHIDPAQVGNKRRFLLSEFAGRTTLLSKLKNIAPGFSKQSPEISKLMDRIKEMEHQGYQFEGADASFELMVKKFLGQFTPHFQVLLYKTMGEFPAQNGRMQSTAMIHVSVDGKEEITAAMGNGPVNALDIALRKALTVFYPQLKHVHLIDYKVRVFDTKKATESRVRVLIESTDGKESWTTVGISTDVIEASWNALVDSIEYFLQERSEDI